MAGSNLMNEEELSQWILRRLGAPLLKVELTECHINDAISDAKHWFSAKKGVKRQLIMPIQSGVSEYELPEMVDTVLDCAPQVAPMDISMVFSPYMLIDEKVPYDVFAAPSSAGVYSSFVQTLQYVETAKRVIGAEFDWRQENKKLYVFPVPKTDCIVWMDFKTNVFTLEHLNERDHDLIKRYALARARLDLAEVRGKYSNYPGAQGSLVPNSGGVLESAKDDLAKLEDEIAQSGFPLGFITG